MVAGRPAARSPSTTRSCRRSTPGCSPTRASSWSRISAPPTAPTSTGQRSGADGDAAGRSDPDRQHGAGAVVTRSGWVRPPTSARCERQPGRHARGGGSFRRGRRHGWPPGRRGGVGGGRRRSCGRATEPRPVLVDAVRRPTRRSSSAGRSRLRGMGTTLCALTLVGHAATGQLRRGSTSATRASTCSATASSSRSPRTTAWSRIVREGQLRREEARPTRSATSSPGRWASTATSRSTCGPSSRPGRPLPAVQRRPLQRGRRGAASPPCCAGSPIPARPPELVRLANEGGGRDNITVVVVDVVDDGGRAESASAGPGRRLDATRADSAQPSTGRYGSDAASADADSAA